MPIETILGTRTMPADAPTVVTPSVDNLICDGNAQPDQGLRTLEMLPADYLAG